MTQAHLHPRRGDPAGKSTGTGRRRWTVGAAVAAMVVGAVGGLAAPASADLAAFGPIDAASNFPAYFTDENGLSLAMCQDGAPLCLSGPELIQDVHAQGGDAESFYYAADADTPHFVLHLALEAAYADGPDPGQEAVFQRTQVTARDGGLVPNADYTVTDPYGVHQCTADALGFIEQNDCRIETPVVGGAFGNALSGRIGPFLTLDPSAPAPPAGYIGDNASARRVTGSPIGFNSFLIEGPGLVGTCTKPDGSTVTGCEQSNLFILQGKLFDTGAPAASTSVGALDFGDVPTTPAVTKPVVYSNIGSQPVTVGPIAVGGTNASAFAQTNTCPATLASGARCTINVTFTPQPGRASNATLTITDNTAASPRTLALSGSNLPDIFVSDPVPPAGLNFGTVAVGSTSVQDNVVIGNRGNGPMTGVTATFTSPNAGQYQFGPNNTCLGATIAPGNGCEIGVQFKPLSTGSKTANLRVTDSTGTVVNIPLSGTGGTAPPADTTPPTAVTLSGSLTGTTASLSWTQATDAVGVTAYRVFRNGTLVSGDISPTAARTFTDTGLAPGTYNYTVRALDAAGNFSVSNTRTLTVPSTTTTVPGAPTIGTAVRGNASATVNWSAPASDGGAAITEYRIQVRTGTTIVRTVPVLDETLRSSVVTGLTNGTAYNFRVRARNSVGVGPLSAASNEVTPSAGTTTTVPGRPAAPTVAQGPRGGALTASATWVPPTNTGGTPITGYIVRAFRITATGSSLAQTSPLLGANVRTVSMTLSSGSYRFTVQARNAVGNSQQSPRSALVSPR